MSDQPIGLSLLEWLRRKAQQGKLTPEEAAKLRDLEEKAAKDREHR